MNNYSKNDVILVRYPFTEKGTVPFKLLWPSFLKMGKSNRQAGEKKNGVKS